MKISWKPPKSSKNHILSDFLSKNMKKWERISSWRSHPWKIFLREIIDHFMLPQNRDKNFSRVRVSCTIWAQNQLFFNEIYQILIKIELNSCTTPYSKFIENHWKVIINSLKINGNQWKSSSKLRENNPFLRENQLFSNKIQVKFSPNHSFHT